VVDFCEAAFRRSVERDDTDLYDESVTLRNVPRAHDYTTYCTHESSDTQYVSWVTRPLAYAARQIRISEKIAQTGRKERHCYIVPSARRNGESIIGRDISELWTMIPAMDITLDELLILEPRLRVPARAPESADSERALGEIYVSWAVSARATPPHLPSLRGGEILLLPERVTAGLGLGLFSLLREARHRGISALVLTSGGRSEVGGDSVADEIPLLEWDGELSVEAETAINRRLTECRGDLYRIGSELERQMADLAANKSGISALARVASAASGLPIAIEDADGRALASSPAREGVAAQNGAGGWAEVRRELSTGATLVLGPLRPEQRVVARFLEERLANVTEGALRRDEAARPRGIRRIAAIDGLLSGRQHNSSEQRAEALALGLDPDVVYFVSVSIGESEANLTRMLSPLGAVYPASQTNGRKLMLIAGNGRTNATSLSERVANIKRRWERDHAVGTATLAISAPALGVASLPSAAREAHFIATLQAEGELPRRAASFESVEDVGALRLLYHLRDSNELRCFVAEALGGLENRDQRGTLKATLRAFLESGGSQVEASNRLGIHRNTLAYRLRRIGELVGRDVMDPQSWLTLHLAMRASQMMRAFNDES
jgi:hypothetical protein